MHHAIREMGLEIVRQENEDEPGQRTRVWGQKDAMRVLTECSGTESVESISVAFLKDTHDVTLNAFGKMTNLRLIYVWIDGYSHSLYFRDETSHLCFKKLKYMHWIHFPFKSLDNFDMCNVVVLTLTESRFETLWEGIKSLKKLRILDVTRSYSLTKTGNLSGLENLEELYFHDCVNLKKLHRSIGDLQKLAILDLRSIRPLTRIPWESMGKLTSLQKLVLGNIHGPSPKLDFEEVHEPLLYSLQKCPITELSLFGCNLSGGVVSLPWLKHFNLWDSNYSSHPDSLLQLHQLNTIEFGYCSLIQPIPNLPGTVTSVKVFGCGSLVNLPSNITELKSLKVLNFKDCPKLGSEDPHFLMKVTGLTNLRVLKMKHCSVSQVPNEIGNLVSLKKLNLSSNPFSSLPDSLSNLSQLLYLNIERCEQLRLLPLIPSNLTEINAYWCRSLGAMSTVSVCTNVCKVYISFPS
ncbi:TMV resistance protein N-like [Bidens hawaiensis]|uniref:TMV resistance protein N-like n=1 Tax=Bidens hawaiensis TaxID=980011 RepID=UPI004049A595